MAVQYDSRIIVTFAEDLYKQADGIVAMYALMGGIIGAVVGAGAGTALGSLVAGLAVGIVLGALMGVGIGKHRAFALRLQAQTALCQVQIETNTRGPAARSVA